MRDAMMQRLAELRYEPTEKRVRVVDGAEVVADTTAAVLVWEPRRVVPSYAVPVEHVRAQLVPVDPEPPSDAKVLHPGIRFSAHSTPGRSYDVQVGGRTRAQAAFQPDDPDLAGFIVLDFGAFEAWYEEDERIVSHPRDPFHRVDVRMSSRPVRIERDGVLLAESSRALLLFETGLPTRYYLPAEDIVAEMTRSDRRTACAYKGEASYWNVGGHRDLAWTYEHPLPDAVQIAGRVAFWNELVDITVDGGQSQRPVTVFSSTLLDEAGLGEGQG
jgi:uncharacterized protein (DUF427 family)